VEWVGVGLAVAKVLLRAADQENVGGGWASLRKAGPNIADALDDARTGWNDGWAGLRRAHLKRQSVGNAIATELKRHLRANSGADEEDLRYAADEVANLLNRLADDDAAVTVARASPDELLDYAKKYGGDTRRRLMSEGAALVHDRVLEVACGQFNRVAPSSSRFVNSALAEILRGQGDIAEDVHQAAHHARRAANGVDRLLKHEQRDVVAAARAATDTGTVLGRPVRDWTPAELGVHPTIVVDDVTGLTPYVPRDHDANLRWALTELRQPGARPRLLTVVGTSCTGKTRTVYEAVGEVLPDWNLVRPADADELTRILYAGIPGHTVVWLDELQDFLTIQGVDAARGIRRLLEDAASPSIGFTATIWPTNLTTLEQRPDPRDAQSGLGEISNLLRDHTADRYAVPNAFKKDELPPVSRNDPRVAAAILHAADGQVTQILAGGTQLVRRVSPDQQHKGDVFSPAARAVILAAADLRRIGYPNPLPGWAIAGAAPGYLEPVERRRLNPATWIQEALDAAAQDATSHQHDALDIHQRGVPALTRLWLGGDNVEGHAGLEHYELHDYLLQHHLAAHSRTPTAANLWKTFTTSSNLAQLSTQIARTLGSNAQHRGLYSSAKALLTPAADDGYRDAQYSLARLLELHGDEDALRARADSGDEEAQSRLAELLVERGDEETLRARADKGDAIAQRSIAHLLMVRGDEDGLRARADMGDWAARARLAKLLLERGDQEGLRARADSGDDAARSRLAELLVERGDEKTLRVRADSGDQAAQSRLANLLLERGDEEGLRARAERGDGAARMWLLVVMLGRGDEDSLWRLVDSGDRGAQTMLLGSLTDRGDEDGLWRLADWGNRPAQNGLSILLGERADVEKLRDLVHAASEGAARELIKVYERARPDDGPLELDVNAEPRLWHDSQR
jgi:hypothetical protein